jgi:hypothetical protein
VGIWDRDYMKSPSWRRRQAAWEAGASSHSGAWRGRGRWILFPLLVVSAVTAGYAIRVMDEQERLNPFRSEPTVTWGGESFYSKREFVGWLAERGIDYRQWSKRHPAVASRLEDDAG